MTSDDFYNTVHKSIEEEHDAGSLYIELAKNAINECDKKMLMKMARQEIQHKANLEWIYLRKDM
jgi:rubrerythrin